MAGKEMMKSGVPKLLVIGLIAVGYLAGTLHGDQPVLGLLVAGAGYLLGVTLVSAFRLHPFEQSGNPGAAEPEPDSTSE